MNQRLFCLSIAFFALASLLSLQPTIAQNTEPETFIDPATELRINYPAGWTAGEAFGGIVIASTEAAYTQYLAGGETPIPGTLTIYIIPDIMQLEGISIAGTLSETAQSLMDNFLVGMTPVDAPSQRKVGAYEAAEFAAQSEQSQAELFGLVVKLNNVTSALIASARLGEMDQFRETVFTIVGNLQIGTSLPVLESRDGGSLEYGSTITDTLQDEDGDQWTFSGSAGDLVRIRSTSVSDTSIQLLGPERTLLIRNLEGTVFFDPLIDGYTLPESGQYTIDVRPQSGDFPADYRLNLQRVEAREPGPIAFDEAVLGGIDQAEEVERWTFTGRQGDILLFWVWPLEFPPPNLRLQGSRNAALIADERADTPTRYVLPASDEYEVLISYGPLVTSATYILEINKIDVPLPQPIEYGDSVQGALEPLASDLWSFTGRAGDEITVSTTGDFQTQLMLLIPSSDYPQLTKSTRSSGRSNIEAYVLPYSGNYQILVQNAQPQSSSTYSLDLHVALPHLLLYDEPIGSTDKEAYFGILRYTTNIINARFMGAAGDVVTIKTSGVENVYVTVEGLESQILVSANCEQVLNPVIFSNIALPVTGEYRVYAESSGAKDMTLTVTHELEPTETDARPDIYDCYERTLHRVEADGSVQGALTFGQGESWSFLANAGDIVSIRIEMDNKNESPELDILGPMGFRARRTAMVIEHIVTLDRLVLPHTGEYRIKPCCQGDFTLTLRRETNPGPGAAAPTGEASSVDGPCVISASSNVVNKRSGPGTMYSIQGTIIAGVSQSPNGQATGVDGHVWWQLEDRSWVRSDVVNATGNCAALPIVNP